MTLNVVPVSTDTHTHTRSYYELVLIHKYIHRNALFCIIICSIKCWSCMCFYFCSRICSGDDHLRECDCVMVHGKARMCVSDDSETVLWEWQQEKDTVCCEGDLLMICPFLSSSLSAGLRPNVSSLFAFIFIWCHVSGLCALGHVSSGSCSRIFWFHCSAAHMQLEQDIRWQSQTIV